MATGTDLSFVVNVPTAVDLYDLSGEGSKFFITVNGRYSATGTDFSCNMWPHTYSTYKIETIKRETAALRDSSFVYVSTVKDVSFDMSYVAGSLHSSTKFNVNQGDKSVSCLPDTAVGTGISHELSDMIFYNLYDKVGGWYSKVKVEKSTFKYLKVSEHGDFSGAPITKSNNITTLEFNSTHPHKHLNENISLLWYHDGVGLGDRAVYTDVDQTTVDLGQYNSGATHYRFHSGKGYSGASNWSYPSGNTTLSNIKDYTKTSGTISPKYWGHIGKSNIIGLLNSGTNDWIKVSFQNAKIIRCVHVLCSYPFEGRCPLAFNVYGSNVDNYANESDWTELGNVGGINETTSLNIINNINTFITNSTNITNSQQFNLSTSWSTPSVLRQQRTRCILDLTNDNEYKNYVFVPTCTHTKHFQFCDFQVEWWFVSRANCFESDGSVFTYPLT